MKHLIYNKEEIEFSQASYEANFKISMERRSRLHRFIRKMAVIFAVLIWAFIVYYVIFNIQ
jgi:hypothetical protein